MGCGITKKVVSRWSYKEGKELTYRQASQLLEIPDAVKTCLHSLHSSPTRKERSHIRGMEIKRQIDKNLKFCIVKTTTTPTFPHAKKLRINYCWGQMFLTLFTAKVLGRLVAGSASSVGAAYSYADIFP